jgi:hypothetical protein
LRKGEVIVQSWESLARELLEAAGVGWDDPVSPAERELYFGDVVPGLMREIRCDELIVPRFDARVVDEAQDHDTRWPGSESGKTDSGWWEITGNFFGKTRMRQWQFSTIKPKGPSFAKRSGSKPRAS